MPTFESPEPAGEGRRFVSAVADAVLAFACGLVAGVLAATDVIDVAVLHTTASRFWGVGLAVAVVTSFLNHVPLTVLTRASIGKLLAGVRVSRTDDGGHPKFRQALRRWLFGLYWAVLVVPIHIAADSGIEQQDATGLRIIRRTRSRGSTRA